MPIRRQTALSAAIPSSSSLDGGNGALRAAAAAVQIQPAALSAAVPGRGARLGRAGTAAATPPSDRGPPPSTLIWVRSRAVSTPAYRVAAPPSPRPKQPLAHDSNAIQNQVVEENKEAPASSAPSLSPNASPRQLERKIGQLQDLKNSVQEISEDDALQMFHESIHQSSHSFKEPHAH
uniref:Uncharacterized protein n=1 Tax=Oryza punctata TaxID=4537 RepID=A0A0E0MDR2_ORYPU